MYLWVEGGVIDREARLFHEVTTDGTTVHLKTRPFSGSVSKVYHAEPVRVSWYSETVWGDESAFWDVTEKLPSK